MQSCPEPLGYMHEGRALGLCAFAIVPQHEEAFAQGGQRHIYLIHYLIGGALI